MEQRMSRLIAEYEMDAMYSALRRVGYTVVREADALACEPVDQFLLIAWNAADEVVYSVRNNSTFHMWWHKDIDGLIGSTIGFNTMRRSYNDDKPKVIKHQDQSPLQYDQFGYPIIEGSYGDIFDEEGYLKEEKKVIYNTKNTKGFAV
jgi:hypothetical protein